MRRPGAEMRSEWPNAVSQQEFRGSSRLIQDFRRDDAYYRRDCEASKLCGNGKSYLLTRQHRPTDNLKEYRQGMVIQGVRRSFAFITLAVVALMLVAASAHAQNPGGSPEAAKVKNPVAS